MTGFELITFGILSFFGGGSMDQFINTDTIRVQQPMAAFLSQYDSTFIPCFDLYEAVWDQEKVAVPGFDATQLEEGVWLCLRDKFDCQYYHPKEGVINSEFGWRWSKMHNGVDVELNVGDAIYAAFDGVVRMAKMDPYGYGLYVVIRHYNGLETLYGHLNERTVEVNQPVRAGDVIGFGGNSGRSTGPHLHFEVRYKGRPMDPQKLINFETAELKMDTLTLDKSYFHYSTTTRKTPVKLKYYKVKSGDNLYRIAKRNGISVEKICKLNRMKENSILPVGKTLKLR
jgi:murein DD-endopeptidase MepM/ murein hydrolase activator NlpD